jgi:hypothetical protein
MWQQKFVSPQKDLHNSHNQIITTKATFLQNNYQHKIIIGNHMHATVGG